MLTLYSGLAWAPLAVFGGLWGNPYLQAVYHVSKTEASYLVTVAFLGLAVGGPLFGWLANRLNRCLPVMMLGVLLSLVSVCYVLLSPFQNLSVVALALFLFGFGTGAFMLGFAVGKRWFSIQLAASVVCLVNTGDALLGAVTEPLVGRLLDFFWQGKMVHGVPIYSLYAYHLAMGLLPVYLLMALLALFFIKMSDRKDEAEVKSCG